jgi:hypothetical protein
VRRLDDAFDDAARRFAFSEAGRPKRHQAAALDIEWAVLFRISAILRTKFWQCAPADADINA